MKRYELLVVLLLGLSTIMKIGFLIALCHIPHHTEETAHELHPCVEKKEQTSHQPNR